MWHGGAGMSESSEESVVVDDGVVDGFRRRGWVLTRTLEPDALAALRGWVDEVASWPDDGGGWMHHRELTDHGPALCRSENVIPFHTGFRDLLTEGSMPAVAGALLGEDAVLYKEKVNYKLPGGAGYSPHQDARAYPLVDLHVSCMVAIDDATIENGCLEVVTGAHHELLPVDDVGRVRADVASTLDWEVVPIPAGHTLWFHSRTPHRSGPNLSSVPRRALYPTYNAASEGDLREDYYRRKRALFATGRTGTDEGRVQVSFTGDFQGRSI